METSTMPEIERYVQVFTQRRKGKIQHNRTERLCSWQRPKLLVPLSQPERNITTHLSMAEGRVCWQLGVEAFAYFGQTVPPDNQAVQF